MEKSIDIRKVNVGDTLYRVMRINHFFSQQKIRMVDKDGIEWYRYDRDRFEYVIQNLKVIGKVTPTVEGDIDVDYGYIRVFAVRNDNQNDEIELCQPYDGDECEENHIFFDLGDAEAYRLELEEADRDDD